MATYLGIDGGGSKTVFLLCDDLGAEITRVRTGPSNWISAGKEAAEAAIREGASQISILPDVVCAGFAGAGRREGAAFYSALLKESFPKSKIAVESDAFIAYIGAIGIRPGALLIAGTGSIAIGRRSDGSMVRAGGWGSVFGDDGSGFWIGREAIRVALQVYDEQVLTPEMERLTKTIIGHLRLSALPDIVTAWSSGQIQTPAIAGLFPALAALYPAEPVGRIFRDAAKHLRSLVSIVQDRVGVANAPVSFAGSIASRELIQALTGLKFEPPLNPPEQGAILWARYVQ